MELISALRLPRQTKLAFTGAGGKTTALFQLARQFDPPVFVTTTTHLSAEQTRLADVHVELDSPGDAPFRGDHLPLGVILFTGGGAGQAGGTHRVRGVDALPLGWIRSVAESRSIPLLMEADGSRRLPLKAPAAHEPAVPDWVDAAVATAGLSGLGKPLSPEFVHRPELFGELAGLAAGAPVTPQVLGRVLAHPAGGLKGMPGAARRVALLNQADTPDLQAAAGRLAETLLGAFDAVLTASLAGAGVLAVHEQTAGVVLAAGAARRMGAPKQLLDWHGRPLVRHAAETALAGGLSPVIVVTGAYAAETASALAGLDVRLVHNADWQAGQAGSVRAGLAAVPPRAGGVMFLLADQPFVTPTLVRALRELHARTLAPIVAPLVDEQRGNPVLFDRATFAGFALLEGDQGARPLFARHRAEWLVWHDGRALLDVDTLADYEAVCSI